MPKLPQESSLSAEQMMRLLSSRHRRSRRVDSSFFLLEFDIRRSPLSLRWVE